MANMPGMPGSEDDLLEAIRLRTGTQALPPDEQQKQVQERARAVYEKAQTRLGELLDSNSTLPVTISSIEIDNARHTRPALFAQIVNPLLSANRTEAYSLRSALDEIARATEKLQRLDIFEQPISVYLHRPDPDDPFAARSDLDVLLTVKEKSRLFLQTGTDFSHADSSAYVRALARNIFGGAESLRVNAALGYRTRSAYQAAFDAPVLGDPDYRWEVGGLASATQKPWASHEEVLRGGWSKLRWSAQQGRRSHEIAYSLLWRQVTGLAEGASPSIRAQAGDNVKSSLSHTWVAEHRDRPLLPSRGYYVKSLNELAGVGPLGGDAAFWKSEIETQAALPIRLPRLLRRSETHSDIKPDGQGRDSRQAAQAGPQFSPVSLTTSIRGGFLRLLSGGGGSSSTTHISDRFHLGGPTDVRGFKMCGIGPRDQSDALGGDAYIAGSANLLMPLPKVSPDQPVRLQAFINAGRLVSMHRADAGQANQHGNGSGSGRNVAALTALRDLTTGIPTTSAGFGLVYAHPMARLEVNFSMPLVVRRGEEARKGLQVGVGINFL